MRILVRSGTSCAAGTENRMDGVLGQIPTSDTVRHRTQRRRLWRGNRARRGCVGLVPEAALAWGRQNNRGPSLWPCAAPAGKAEFERKKPGAMSMSRKPASPFCRPSLWRSALHYMMYSLTSIRITFFLGSECHSSPPQGQAVAPRDGHRRRHRRRWRELFEQYQQWYQYQ